MVQVGDYLGINNTNNPQKLRKITKSIYNEKPHKHKVSNDYERLQKSKNGIQVPSLAPSLEPRHANA